MSEGVSTIGHCISVSAAVSAVKDQAGYEGLTWLPSNEVIDSGAVGPESEVLTYKTKCDGKINKRLGATNFGSQELQLAYDSANVAQVVWSDAQKSREAIAMREVLPNGDTLYYDGRVTKAVVDSSGEILKYMVGIEVDTEVLAVLV